MNKIAEIKPIPKYANIVFWIAISAFAIEIVTIFVSLKFREVDGLSELANYLMMICLLVTGLSSFVSILWHPKFWVKGISLLLLAYFVLIIWAMQS